MMASRSLAGGLAAGCAVAALTIVGVEARTAGAPASIDELLNPAAMAASICRAPASTQRMRPLRLAALGEPEVDLPPKLYEGLGSPSIKATTRSPEAQAYVDQGLRLAYGFNHFEAARAFREAQRLDPGCALCSWGEALVLGMNINAPMDPADHGAAVAAIARAVGLKAAASPMEQALIDAVAVRYAPLAAGGEAADEAGYAAAMREVHRRWPDHDEIAVLFAESLMNLQPWDYWEADGTSTKGEIGEAVEAVEAVLARNPDHPQAIHLYIHLTEASAAPERAEPYAERLAAAAPGLGHLVHMPSHIYFVVGRYKDSLDANIAAVAVDEGYMAQSRSSLIYGGIYYPHNVHMGLISAQMGGDRANALALADKLKESIPLEAAVAIGPVQPIAAGPYFAYAQFGEPAAVLALPPPDPRLSLVTAVWRYARSIAAIQSGDLATAERELAALAEMSGTEPLDALEAQMVPAGQIVAIARLVAEGKLAQAKGDSRAAIAALREAVAIQDGIPYMEPPFWYYPVRQSLGAALLAAGQPAEAATVLEQSLVETPHNGWAMWALAEARRAGGDQAGAAALDRELEQVWFGPRELLELSRL